MISSLAFINHKGEILIYRVYKDDITRSEILQFCTKIVARKENKESPIVYIDGTSFIHINVKDIIILATTKENVNVGMIFYFLYKLIDICKAYFNQLDENQIKKHFVLIYELLDEIMDYGLPQIMDYELLKQFIMEGGEKQEVMNDMQKLKQLTSQATGAQSWRPEGIFYKKNEVYIDIVEHVNLLMNVKGSVLRADVSGQVICKTQLSGMPECKFGLNDKLLLDREPRKDAHGSMAEKGIAIDDLKFHQCVKLPKFDKERAITFVPPDGVFELMSYRVTENVNLPFKIMPVVNELGKRIEVRVKLKSIFDRSIFATNVALKVPCPKNTAIVNCKSTLGRAKYEPDQGGIIWRIKKFQGDTEDILRCDIDLSQTNKEIKWVPPPISMEFQVPMFTASGLRVRFLRISEKNDYKPTKWIRYVTKGGDYQHRI
ncbi:Mu homology domain [Pseudocohnilembus persalinus]|uniref:Mu homology domain n=1 Tax=Pseudocohnilembus persalinus TaxID=266149 RepID=A0A0V0R8J9_PSEPJ|nr:Mu homology domain [Pseudocohnilembus persalinus]|eukprot:KRX10823.1 Mu homology domain [Pseudocohnilembus persalinus]